MMSDSALVMPLPYNDVAGNVELAYNVWKNGDIRELDDVSQFIRAAVWSIDPTNAHSQQIVEYMKKFTDTIPDNENCKEVYVVWCHNYDMMRAP